MAKHVRNIAFIIFLLWMCFKSHSQCQPVCIKGGSVGVTGTITAAGNSTVTQAAGTTFTVQQKAGTTFTTQTTGTVSITGTSTVAVTGTVPISGSVTVVNSVSTLTTNVIVATSVVTSNGSTSPNTFQISFLTSDDFTGSINGATVGGNVSITMPLINYRTYPSIAYTRTTGSIVINEIR